MIIHAVYRDYEQGKELAKNIKDPRTAIEFDYRKIVEGMVSIARKGDIFVPMPCKRPFDYTKLITIWMHRYWEVEFEYVFKKPTGPQYCEIKNQPNFKIEMLPDIEFELEGHITKHSFINNERIVLVDNVYDTGKTTQSAIKALRKVTNLPIAVTVITLGKYANHSLCR